LTPTGWRRKLVDVTEQESRIQDYVARPARYANIDGLNELTWGAMACGFACFDWLNAIFPHDSLWHRTWVQMVYTPVMVLLIYSAGRAFKRNVTFRRTGFVAYPQTARGRMAPLIAAALAVVAALAAAFVVRGGVRVATLLGAVNFLFYMVAAQPLRPWKSGFLALIAAGALWVPDANALLFFGLIFLASGATTLTLYLRRTQHAQ
jgi:hypothetical protein